MPRSTEYGSPYRNEGSGVDEDRDSENKARFAQGMKNFAAHLKSKKHLNLPWLFSIFSNEKFNIFGLYD